VGHKTDSICRISREDKGIHGISPRVGEDEAKLIAAVHGRSSQSIAGKFRLPDREVR
jgi:hypothetical protein